MKKIYESEHNTVYKVTGGRCNVFLIQNFDKRILVDSSVVYCRNKVDKILKANGIDRIDYLLITHSHFDHAANADYLAKKYGAKTLAGTIAAGFLHAGANESLAGTNFISRIIANIGMKILPKLSFDPVHIDFTVTDEQDLTSFGLNGIKILYTPGHTAGSISVLIDKNIALTGDALFGIFPWGVLPPFASNVELMKQSWKKLLNSGAKEYHPSHARKIKASLLAKECGYT